MPPLGLDPAVTSVDLIAAHEEGHRSRMSAEDDPSQTGTAPSAPIRQGRLNTPGGSSQQGTRDEELVYDDFPDFDQATLERTNLNYAEAEECWANQVAEGCVYGDTLIPDDLRELVRRIRQGESRSLRCRCRYLRGPSGSRWSGSRSLAVMPGGSPY